MSHGVGEKNFKNKINTTSLTELVIFHLINLLNLQAMELKSKWTHLLKKHKNVTDNRQDRREEQRNEGLEEGVMRSWKAFENQRSDSENEKKERSLVNLYVWGPPLRLDSNILEGKKKRETSWKRDAGNERGYMLWTTEGGMKRGNKWGESRGMLGAAETWGYRERRREREREIESKRKVWL